MINIRLFLIQEESEGDDFNPEDGLDDEEDDEVEDEEEEVNIPKGEKRKHEPDEEGDAKDA